MTWTGGAMARAHFEEQSIERTTPNYNELPGPLQHGLVLGHPRNARLDAKHSAWHIVSLGKRRLCRLKVNFNGNSLSQCIFTPRICLVLSCPHIS